MAVPIPPAVVTNELIESSWGNTVRAAVQALINESVARVPGSNLSAQMERPLNMNQEHIFNVPDPTAAQHAANMQWVNARVETRMRVNGADTMTGNLLVGGHPDDGTGVQVTTGGRVYSAFNTSGTANLVLRRFGATGAMANGEPFVRFQRLTPGDTIGSITIASTSSVSYNTTSDPRLKRRVADLTDALDRVAELGAHAYRGVWLRDEQEADDGAAVDVHDMLDATAIAECAPYAVTGEPDAVTPDGGIDPMQVNYQGLVPLLCAALADARGRIAQLEERIGE